MSEKILEHKKPIIKTIYDLDKGGMISNIDWKAIGTKEILTEKFMRDYQYLLSWRIISIYQTMSEPFLKEFKKKLHWGNVCMNHLLPETFLEEIQDDVFIDWEEFSTNNLSEETIRHYEKYIFWNHLSTCSELSEDFIRDYKDKVFWRDISKEQTLSEIFINEFKDRIDWFQISRSQKISYKFILQNISKINIVFLKGNDSLELSTGQWKEIEILINFKHLFANK
jgi:hypothetical protein